MSAFALRAVCGAVLSVAIATPVLAAVSAGDSSVTLYGLIDMGFRTDSNDHQSRSSIESGIAGQSRWGLRGQEDLGNGLKATFQLESGFNGANGSNTQGRLFGRQATVGLKGGFGEIRMGRQVVLGYAWTPFVASPFGVSWSRNSIGTTFGYKSGDFGADGRISNSVLYFTPKWNGLEAAIGYSFDAEMQQGFATGDNDRVTTAGLRYSNGPLVVAATYEQLNPSNQTPDRRDAKNFQFGVAYDFEIIKLHAGYNEQRDINLNPAPGYVAAGNDRDRAYTFGVSVPVGSGRVMASYQNAVLSKSSGIGLAYQYYLSKRTNLYVMFNDTDTRNFRRDEDVSRRQFGFGIQHSF
ncbi:porin [Achromobacter denitrificans]|uniref:porin n=1 Tax=Achromobacter denitrificans TaxID=32002 RepID=UPI000B1D01E9|nr:porin [Achromobacter denitrificans]GFN25004.1 porin [Achromobacter denitrificans]